MGYIDIHTHIIPGIDDGSASNQESVAMLRQAYEAGVTTIVATPHFSKGFCEYTDEEIKRYCKALEKLAKEKVFSGFCVVPGQEIFLNENSLDKIRKGEVITLGESNYILVEFSPAITYPALYAALREIAMTAFYPILAHIEVYECLREKGRIEELRDLGVVLQMNYYHIGDSWYKETVRWCRSMLKNGRVDLLGTDMHNSTDRGPRMESALAWMDKHLEEDYVEDLTWRTAHQVIGLPLGTPKPPDESNPRKQQAEMQQTETKQTETKQTEMQQTETKQSETKQTETKQTETQQAETKQTETQQTETQINNDINVKGTQA